MKKEIHFAGINVVPTDHDAQDGMLEAAYNLLPERSGALSPILPHRTVLARVPHKVIGLHKVSGGRTNVLVYDAGKRMVMYAPMDDVDAGYASVTSSDSEPKVAILDKTLFFSDGESSSYARWDTERESYVSLGRGIPEVEISLALAHKTLTGEVSKGVLSVPIPEGVSTDLTAALLGGLSGGRRLVPPRSSSDAFIDSVSNAVIGFADKTVADAANDGLFMMPFMVRWAIRLFDGSYIHQSAPILMIPNSAAPPVRYKTSTDNGIIKMEVEMLARKCRLMYRMEGLSDMCLWRDVVKSVDFFVSPPIYTYDQSGSVSVSHRQDREMFSHSGAESPMGSGVADMGGSHRHPVTPVESDVYYEFADGNVESGLTFDGSYLEIEPFTRQHIEDAVTSAAAFHLIASVSLDLDSADATAGMPGFVPLPIEDASLRNIAVRPALGDDWRSHDRVVFRHPFAYNSRLVLSGVGSRLFGGFALRSMSQYSVSADNADAEVDVWVKVVRNARPYWVVRRRDRLMCGRLPRLLYYPDANAVEMRVVATDGSGGWALPLKRHDFLNGAYWFDGLGRERTGKQAGVKAPERDDTDALADEPNRIFVSEVSNPYFLPSEGSVTVGSGSVMATSAAVMALSQGQFGSFPLYAFSTDGVWALTVSGTGTFSAVQPVCRDVLLSCDSVAQIDRSVVFASGRGLMLLSGSSVEELSVQIHTDMPFDISRLRGGGTLLSMVGHNVQDSMMVPFRDYLSGSRIAYDYRRQRIVVYNPDMAYCYVYCMGSKQWGMSWSRIFSSLNSYPDSLVLVRDHDGESYVISDLSDDDGDESWGMLITRPIGFGDPDMLKTVSRVMVRGVMRETTVKVALYGTRDFRDWHLVASSGTAHVGNFRGTPWKCFRLVVLGQLRRDESLMGASFEMTPRFVNRLR